MNRIVNKLIFLYTKIKDIVKNCLCTANLYYITEQPDWIIRKIGEDLVANLPKNTLRIRVTDFGIKNAIIHYPSFSFFVETQGSFSPPHKSNKIIVSWFHVAPENKDIEQVSKIDKHVDLWHTASSMSKNELLKLGIPENKIVIVPLGIDLNVFKPRAKNEKINIRKTLGIPEDSIVIGSFQKDGNGWGEGLTPKLIKGPDVFCDVVERLNKNNKIFILLTGPARGFVKGRLDKAGIPYIHSYLKRVNDLRKYYNALDIYLISSRIEGGPKSILEAFATGVPLVSTKVGMPHDLITNDVNAFISEVEDINDLTEKIQILIKDSERRDKFINNGFSCVKSYCSKTIAQNYLDNLYYKS